MGAQARLCRGHDWPEHVSVAVNVSPVQFRNPALALDVVSILAASGLPAGRLELEITESVLMQNNDTTLATLHQIRDLGVRISMDDFGTGYSSLSYLRSFPFDKIKIDRSFISDLSKGDEAVGHRSGHSQPGAQPQDDDDRRGRGNGGAKAAATGD